MKRELLNNLIERAVGEEMGLVVKTNNPVNLLVELRKARKELGIKGLIFARPSNESLVYIIKETVELDP